MTVLGLPLATFTLLHVIISLLGIASGLIVFERMLRNRPLGHTNGVFLLTTVLTSVSGFLFPFKGVTPAIIVGVVSLVALATAVIALYVCDLRGAWRWIYVVSALLALYLNVFVFVVQAFAKIAPLHALAPTEPPFAVVQAIVLLAFLGLGAFAVRRYRPLTA